MKKKNLLKENIKKEKEYMHPLRWKLTYIGVWLYLLIAFGGAVGAVVLDVAVLGSVDKPSVLTWVGVLFFVLVSVVFVLLSEKITKLEVQDAMDEYSYLLTDGAPLETDTVEICNQLDEFSYTVNREGVTVKKPHEEGEQVFDEVKNGVLFMPWDRTDVLIVTSNLYRRARFAVAVINKDAETEEDAIFFIEMRQDLYQALYAFGLAEHVEEDLKYLRYNPKNALKQIVGVGRVVTLRDKDTGKRINEEEFFKE